MPPKRGGAARGGRGRGRGGPGGRGGRGLKRVECFCVIFLIWKWIIWLAYSQFKCLKLNDAFFAIDSKILEKNWNHFFSLFFPSCKKKNSFSFHEIFASV